MPGDGRKRSGEPGADLGPAFRHFGRFLWAAPLAVAAIFSIGCASSSTVTRMVRGKVVRGRFVGDEAYAAYLRGAVFEAQGNREAALVAYTEATRRDPNSAELFTRVGALLCAELDAAAGRGEKRDPWEAFSRASQIDPAYEEAWTERGRCHLRHGELNEAARAVQFAISLDPNRTEPVILLSLIFERQGNLGEARRWLDGLVAREPTSVAALEAMSAFAARTQDEGRRETAERTLAQLRRAYGTPRIGRASLVDVDSTLSRGDFAGARKLALSARVPSGALALRAAAMGIASFAKAQADMVLAADPGDSDARIAAVVAADLERDDAGFRAALTAIPASTPPSPLGTLLMSELLERRVGPEARKAWDGAAGTIGDKDDPLIARVAARR